MTSFLAITTSDATDDLKLISPPLSLYFQWGALLRSYVSRDGTSSVATLCLSLVKPHTARYKSPEHLVALCLFSVSASDHGPWKTASSPVTRDKTSLVAMVSVDEQKVRAHVLFCATPWELTPLCRLSTSSMQAGSGSLIGLIRPKSTLPDESSGSDASSPSPQRRFMPNCTSLRTQDINST